MLNPLLKAGIALTALSGALTCAADLPKVEPAALNAQLAGLVAHSGADLSDPEGRGRAALYSNERGDALLCELEIDVPRNACELPLVKLYSTDMPASAEYGHAIYMYFDTIRFGTAPGQLVVEGKRRNDPIGGDIPVPSTYYTLTLNLDPVSAQPVSAVMVEKTAWHPTRQGSCAFNQFRQRAAY